MTQSIRTHELETGVEPESCVQAGGKINGQGRTDELIVDIGGIGIGPGAIAYAVGYAVAKAEGRELEKVAVEPAVETYDVAYTGCMVTTGTSEGGAAIVREDDTCLDAGIAEGEVVGGSCSAIGTIGGAENVAAKTVSADEILAVLVAGYEMTTL